MDLSGHLHVPAALPPGTRWIGGWVGPRSGLDVGIGMQHPNRHSVHNLIRCKRSLQLALPR